KEKMAEVRERHKSPAAAEASQPTGTTTTTNQQKVDNALDWAYLNMGGETWDCQPACWITDYVLAVQCFISTAAVVYSSSNRTDSMWYMVYFVAMGTTASLGGFLHHMAFKAMKKFNLDPAKTSKRVFGVYLQQSTVDTCLAWVWRFCLGFTTLTNFALVAAPASRYLSLHLSELTIWIAGVGYSFVGAAAFVKMQTSIMLLGFLPPMFFGGISAVASLSDGWLLELLVLLFILAGGLVQAAEAAPSHKHFNHNALAHVLLSASATAMIMHFYMRTPEQVE
ncbi:hypothetical protein DYB31_005307, partial [Aphanomyces astaci]